MTGDVGRIYAIDSYVGDTVTLTRNPLTDITGETVAIRRYLTIGDLDILDGASVTLLNGTAPATNATLFFGAWSPAGVENTIIQPGEGVIINTGTAFPLTVYGSVSTDDVILELDMTGGSYVVGSLNPVDGSGDVLPALVSGLGSGSNMVELLPGVGGGTITYNEFFGWSPDPAGIDVSDYRTVVVTTTPTDIVMPANVIAP
jgi:hypothetical protein